MLEVVSVFMLALHLLCVDISAGGPLVCVGLEAGVARLPKSGLTMAQQLAVWCLGCLLVGGVLGVLVAWLDILQGYSDLRRVLPQFAHKVGWGAGELVCYFLWMGGYWLWGSLAPPARGWQRALRGLLAVVAATNLLYHFPPLLTVMAKAAGNEIQLAAGPVTPAEFRRMALTPEVIAHTLHFWMASLAVTAVLVMQLAVCHPCPPGERQRVITGAARLGLFTSLLQIPIGMWLLSALPQSDQSRLLGGDLAGTLLLMVSILVAFCLLQSLAGLAFGAMSPNAIRRAVVLMLVAVLLMTATQRRARDQRSGSGVRGQELSQESGIAIRGAKADW